MKSFTLATATATLSLFTLASAERSNREILSEMVPNANTCDASAPTASECATVDQAILPILTGFVKYKIGTPQEQAALVSWMAYESAEFKYNKNHFPAPGRPGQGCRNMMMPEFVKKYALTLPEVTSKVDVNTAAPAAILDAVNVAGLDFAAASWYYVNYCTDAQKKYLVNGGRKGWEGFVTGCVQTTMDEGRVKYWSAAAKALGLDPTK